MGRLKVPLIGLLCLCLVALVAGCGSTDSGSTGTFSVSADHLVTIAQGQTRTFTVTPSATEGFKGSVQISVSGMPSGVTLSPANATVSVGTATTFTLTAASDATVGTSTLVVQGISGSLNARTAVSLVITGTTASGSGTFTLTASPATLSVAAGSSGQVTLSSTGSNGFSGTIAVAVAGLPSGVTVSPATISLTPGTPVTVTLTAASDAPATTSPAQVSFTGTSGTQTAEATVALTVTTGTSPATPDFSLTASPATLALTPGGSGQVTLSSTASGGFSGTVAITVTGLPTGVSYVPTTISLTPGTPVTVTLTAASDAPATAAPVEVDFVGTSGTLSHKAKILLTVNTVAAGPDFVITATPKTMPVAQEGQSDNVVIGVTGTNGFSGTVNISVTGLPTGVRAIPPSSLQAGSTGPMVFIADDTAPIGDATVTIVGTSGALTEKTTMTLTVTAPVPPDTVSLAVLPTSQTVTVGSIATVSVTASANNGYAGTVNVSATSLPTGILVSPATAVLTLGTPATFTVIATENATPGSDTVTFLGQVNSVSGSADLNLTVVNPTNAGLDVPTWHYDRGRKGLYANETSLTPTSVTTATFGKRTVLATDGAVDAQPLYLSGITIGAQSHDVLYVATENDSVYAFDAATGSQLWKTSALKSGETAADNRGCNELSSQVGITSTPVIDRYFAPDGAIYFVAKSKDSSGNYHQRLHALDLTTGAELTGSPTEITATYPGTGGTNTFDPSIFVERAALLLSNGTVYLSWAAPCHQTSLDYQSWVMAYSEGTVQQQSVLNLTPNGVGGGIWMSDAGPAADSDGFVFLATSKGTFDTTLVSGTNSNLYPVNGDYGNGFVKIQNMNGVISLFDYFEPLNGVQESATNYQDQGSGGVLLVPDIPIGNGNFLSLAAGAGKDGNIYYMGRTGDFMGEYDGQNDNIIYTITNALPNGASSTPAYFNQTLYYGGIGDSVRAIDLLGTETTSQSASTFGPAGATPVISANGTSTPIVWALDTTASGGPVLHAYDATDLTNELYNSAQATGSRDAVGATGTYTVPVVANGSVYIGTQSGLAVFGLLP
jgi:uncharacterized membrane protein